MATIAFIGLGNMGGPMAANLVKAGHKVVAFDLVEASRAQGEVTHGKFYQCSERA
ncbi:NAD(P)-binding domain-containing protein, partial [Bradyrhizobium sp. SHOUNA76]|uniref:NAD(P)-binding domain-containing protein n=1 Tax=Bradyrhizobium sp. SHOUNA76 TaxID=2908927 RepID=UPI001FF64FC4